MLSLKQEVLLLMLPYLLPDGRRLIRRWAGWEESAMILLAFFSSLVGYSDDSAGSGRLEPIILAA